MSSHTTTCPLESWNTFTTSSNFFSIYLRACFHLSFLSLQTQHPEPHVSRACFNPERKRERERESGRRQVSLRVAGRTRRVCGQERPNGLKIQTHGRIPAWARPLGAFSFLAGTVAIHDPRMKIRTRSKRFR